MRKLKELLRLHFDLKLSQRQIAKTLSLSVGAVNKYIKRAIVAGINWPLAPEIENDEEALAASLTPVQVLLPPSSAYYCASSPSSPPCASPSSLSSFAAKSQFDFTVVHQEMRRKGVTLQLLHEELSHGYQGDDFISYSHFALLYRRWRDKLPRSMRQVHKAGDKVFIDYSGQKVTIIDPDTNLNRETEIFIGVLGCSNYTYVEATWSQQLADWISSQRRMFDHSK